MLQYQSDIMVKQVENDHSTFTEANHLSTLNKIKPAHFGGVIQEAFSAHYYSDNPFTTITSKMGAEKVLEGNEMEYTYMLKLARTRPNLYAGEGKSGPQGLQGQRFTVELQKNWYLPGDVISPGDPRYLARIQRIISVSGESVTLECQQLGGNPAQGIPAKYFQLRTPWRKMYSNYEEGSEEAGSTIYSGEAEYRGRMTRLRKTYKVTGDVHNRALAVDMKGRDGKSYRTWVSYAEAEFWMQFYKERERAKIFGRGERTVMGSTNRPVFSSAGLHHKLERAPQYKFNKFNMSLLEHAALDINYGRTKPGEGSDIYVFTGEQGMTEINKGVASDARNNGFTMDMAPFLIGQVASPYHPNALSYGGQFTQLNAPNGRKIKVMHMPAYDDPTNSDINPETGRTYLSNRMTILEIANGEYSNVCSVRRKLGLSTVYVSGMTGPFGKKNRTEGAHSGDYYSVTIQDDCGIHLADPSRCVVLEQNR